MKTSEIMAATHIRDAVAEALADAIQSGESVSFDFNGRTITVEPTDSYDDAKARAESVLATPVLSPEEEQEQVMADIEQRKAAWAKAIADAGVPTEQELRDASVPTPDTEEQLIEYIRALVDRPHDYGTCVYAMSMSAVAAFNFVARKLGVTGFQANCADMDVLRRTRGFEWGRLLNYENLLYPQYCTEEHFPSPRALFNKHGKQLAEHARALLAGSPDAHPEVRAHWHFLAALDVVEEVEAES